MSATESAEDAARQAVKRRHADLVVEIDGHEETIELMQKNLAREIARLAQAQSEYLALDAWLQGLK